MGFDPDIPFNDLPLLPPPGELETKAVLKAVVGAHRALAELKGAGRTAVPNQSILVHAVSLQEARSSSEIEGIVTTTDQLYRALSQTSAAANDPQTKEVLRYSEALWHGYTRMRAGRPLSTNLYVELVQLIKQNDAGIRKTTGTKLRDLRTDAVVYTPPEGESVLRDKLSNLDSYLHANDNVDPLVKMAVAHYQFEAIHPFGDGNGRTGRIINILYLIARDLLELPVLYLSGHIIATKARYYELLRSVTEQGAWEPWVLYAVEAIERTARQTLKRIHAIRDLMAQTGAAIHDKLPNVYSKDLLEKLFEMPYCRISFLIDAGIAKRQTASEYLQKLAEAGFVSAVKIGREMVYVNGPFFELLRREAVEEGDVS